MEHFSWLADKKREAAMRRVGSRSNSSFAAMPLRARYLGYTGTGEDGEVQPSNPTHMINTSAGRRMLHEDEQVYAGPNNELEVVPSPYTQRKLRQMEQDEKVPGYQYGTSDVNTVRVRPVTSAAKSDMTLPSSGNTVLQAPAVTSDTYRTTVGNAASPPASTMQLPPTARTIGSAPSVSASTFRSTGSGADNPALPSYSQPLPARPSMVLPQENANLPSVTPEPIEPVEPVASTTVDPSVADRFRTTAMARTGAAARGVTPEYDAALQRQIDDARATQDAEQQSLAQQAAQLGISEEALAARQAMDRAAGRQATANLVAQGALGKGQLQQQATSDLAGQALATQQFEEDKKRYGDTDQWRAYEAAIAAGDYTTAAQAYKTITGNDISMGEMRTYQDYLNRTRAQAVESGDVTLNRLKNTLGDEVANSIQSRINANLPLEAINNEFGTNLSQAEYNSMREATAIGERDWDRRLNATNMLLQTQDPNNIATAATQLGELFPGVTFDMNQLINDVGADRFAQNMKDMSVLSTTFDTWADAKSSAEGLNIIGSLGEDQASQLFRGLKVNEIDKEWSVIQDSSTYKALLQRDPAAAKLIEDTFIAGLTGELEYDITYDEDGRPQYVYKNITTGDTVIVNNAGEIVNGAGENTPTTNDAWTSFQDSMSAIPEDAKPNYSEWKSAWEKAGSPSGWGYDDYTAAKGSEAPVALGEMRDKYKDGWPPIKFRTSSENKPYLVNDQGNSMAIGWIEDARNKFTATPTDVAPISPDTSAAEIRRLWNEYRTASSEGAVDTNFLSDFTTGNIMTVEGYDSPFILADPLEFEKSYSGVPESITLISLKDGEIVTLNQTGKLRK